MASRGRIEVRYLPPEPSHRSVPSLAMTPTVSALTPIVKDSFRILLGLTFRPWCLKVYPMPFLMEETETSVCTRVGGSEREQLKRLQIFLAHLKGVSRVSQGDAMKYALDETVKRLSL